MAGAAEVGADVETFRRDLLSAPRDPAAVAADVADMRRRLAEAKPPEGHWEAKRGPGRMTDIELLAQAAALVAGRPERAAPAQLAAGQAAGWLEPAEVERLTRAYRRFWQVQAGSRLLTGGALKVDELGDGGRGFLLRQTGAESFDGLAAELQDMAAEAASIIDAVLARSG